MTTGMAPTDQSRKVFIVGFAPSYTEVPWAADNAEFWGLNALHRLLPDVPWTRWFQLHDLNTTHQGDDRLEHLKWLQQCNLPVMVFDEHVASYDGVATKPYPRQEAIERFGDYFTNSVSWMIALAILEGFEEIAIYGVDMAQNEEYANQRPSCEYLIGMARGLGIKVEIANGSDLLRSSHLYGVENFNPMRRKMDARFAELQGKRNELAQQLQIGQNNLAQIDGAIEDLNYWRRVWTQPEGTTAT